MLGWRWRGFCNTYSMTMLHFVPFTSIDRSSSSVGATSISFDSSCAARRCEKLSPNLCGRAQKGSLQDSGRPRTVLAMIQGNDSGLFGRVMSERRSFYAPPDDGVSRARSAARASRRVIPIPAAVGCAPPNTRRAIRSMSSSIVTASRLSSSVAAGSL